MVPDLKPSFIDLLLQTATGVVTTNYDLEVDLALAERVGYPAMEDSVDYGFAWRDPGGGKVIPRPVKPTFHLLKLHGSLNWLLCPLCEHTYINVYGSIQEHAFYKTQTNENTCHCGHFPLTPVIVSPSYVRDIRNADLLSLWKNALEYLRTARKWVIIGYSLPSEDLAIRSLLMRAFRAREEMASAPKIHVVQRAHEGALTNTDIAFQARYLSLFSQVTFHYGGLEKYLHEGLP